MHVSVSATRRAISRLLSLAVLQQFLPPQAGHAVKGAKGAAELDAEFYLRGLLGQPSLPPLKLELPNKDRALSGVAACTLLSATRAALASTLDISVSEVAARASARRSSLAIEYERSVLAGAFGPAYDMSMAGGARLALGQASGATACTDGGGAAAATDDVGLYEFELSLYALFTLLSEARLPPGRQRAFYALLGDGLLAAQLSSSPAAQPATGSAVSLKRVESGLEALLQALQRAGYLAGFKIDNSDADEALWAQRSELSTTRYTINLANPASLRAATQLNAASGGRLTAGLAVPLLLAFLRILTLILTLTLTPTLTLTLTLTLTRSRRRWGRSLALAARPRGARRQRWRRPVAAAAAVVRRIRSTGASTGAWTRWRRRRAC